MNKSKNTEVTVKSVMRDECAGYCDVIKEELSNSGYPLDKDNVSIALNNTINLLARLEILFSYIKLEE